MIPVPTLSKTRRNIRVLLGLGCLLAVLVGGMGGLIFFLGWSRPDVTQPFWETGCYVMSLCGVNLGIFVALFWQVSRLSRRPERSRSGPQIPQISAD